MYKDTVMKFYWKDLTGRLCCSSTDEAPSEEAIAECKEELLTMLNFEKVYKLPILALIQGGRA